MPDHRNATVKTDKRNPDGTFAQGNAGKPRGARHQTTKAIESLLQGQSEALTQKAVDMALAGDATALRLCLERLAPVRKDAPVNFDLPAMQSTEDAAGAAQAVIFAVSEGQITPLEGAQIMALIESYRKTMETADIERRVAALEGKQ